MTKLSDVTKHIEEYLAEHLPTYKLKEVRRKSAYPEDDYLYMVIGQKDTGEYAVWTSWNESTRSLNHGHYMLKSYEACTKIMDENYTAAQ